MTDISRTNVHLSSGGDAGVYGISAKIEIYRVTKVKICLVKYEDYQGIFFLPPNVGVAALKKGAQSINRPIPYIAQVSKLLTQFYFRTSWFRSLRKPKTTSRKKSAKLLTVVRMMDLMERSLFGLYKVKEVTLMTHVSRVKTFSTKQE